MLVGKHIIDLQPTSQERPPNSFGRLRYFDQAGTAATHSAAQPETRDLQVIADQRHQTIVCIVRGLHLVLPILVMQRKYDGILFS